MSFISGLKKFGKLAAHAAFGPVGLLVLKKKSSAQAKAAPKPAGQQGVETSKHLLNDLLGPLAGGKG